MILRQLNEYDFEKIQTLLTCKGQQNPLDADFHITMTVNNWEYILEVQPITKRRIAVMQALIITREKDDGISHILITDNKILLALFELLLFQGAA